MKPFKEVIDGIRKAVMASEVREDIAQGMEYVEQFANTAGENIQKAIDPTLSVSGRAADAAKVGEAVGQVKEDLESTENLNNKHLLTSWINGYIDSDGNVLNASYRAVTADYITEPYEISVSVADGYQFAVAYYSADGDASYVKNYDTSPLTIPSNTKFKVSVYAKPEDTSSGIIDPTEYGKMVTMTYQTELLRKVSEIDELAKQIDNQSENFINKKYKDIFKNKMCHVGKIVNPGTDSSYVDNISFSSSEFIDVNPETTYCFAIKSEAYGFVKQVITRIIYYNDRKNYISFEEGGKSAITTPKYCKYIIFCSSDEIIRNSFDDVIIEESDDIVFPLDKGFAKNSLTDKKWMVIGDSITEKNFRTAANYHDFIRAETGCEILNCGVSGSGYVMMHTSNNAFRDRIPTYSSMTPDFITIMGGINDVLFAHQGGTASTTDDIGVYTDTTEESVMGCVYLTYVQVLAVFPNIPFGIMSPIPEIDYNPQNANNVLAYFADELEKFCKHYGVPYLNQYLFSNLRPWDTLYNKKFFSCPSTPDGDGLHPNYYGHEMIYPKIREFVKTLV